MKAAFEKRISQLEALTDNNAEKRRIEEMEAKLARLDENQSFILSAFLKVAGEKDGMAVVQETALIEAMKNEDDKIIPSSAAQGERNRDEYSEWLETTLKEALQIINGDWRGLVLWLDYEDCAA